LLNNSPNTLPHCTSVYHRVAPHPVVRLSFFHSFPAHSRVCTTMVPSSPPPGIDTSSSSTHHQHGDSCADCTSSCDPSVSLPPLPPAVKPRVLAIKLQPLWEDDKCEWSVETVTRRVRGYFPSAPPGYCQQVYRHLQSTRSTLDDKQQNAGRRMDTPSIRILDTDTARCKSTYPEYRYSEVS